jgi:hypothetical protein
MRLPKKPEPKVKTVVEIVTDPKTRKTARILHDGNVIFAIKVDTSGAKPAITVTAMETYLKFMESGKTGITLWNGRAEPPRH